MAKDVNKSYDSLVDIFECIRNFLKRLNIYTEIPSDLASAMTEIVTKIMAELITVLALATKQMKQGRLSTFALTNNSLSHRLLYGREIRKETFGREGDRIRAR
jgi:hypothetical protein